MHRSRGAATGSCSTAAAVAVVAAAVAVAAVAAAAASSRKAEDSPAYSECPAPAGCAYRTACQASSLHHLERASVSVMHSSWVNNSVECSEQTGTHYAIAQCDSIMTRRPGKAFKWIFLRGTDHSIAENYCRKNESEEGKIFNCRLT